MDFVTFSVIFTKVVLIYLAADFISGVVHWLEDTYGMPDMPIIGKYIVLPNIEHHRHPSMIGSMLGFIGRNGIPMLGALAFLLLCWILGFLGWELWLLATLSIMSNEVHNWNHKKIESPIVHFLWDSQLIQSRKQHALHHVPQYDKYYCTLGNIMNAILEVLRFWRIMEWIIRVFLRIKVKRGVPERDGY